MIEFSQKREWVEIASGPGTSTSNVQKTEHGVLRERGGPESRREKQGRQIYRGSITGSPEQRAKGQGCPGGPGHRMHPATASLGTHPSFRADTGLSFTADLLTSKASVLLFLKVPPSNLNVSDSPRHSSC